MSHIDASKFSRYLDHHADVLIVRPVRIVLIIVIALIVRSLVHRAIARLTRATAEGSVPTVLRPLRERAVHASSLFEAGLLQSERRRQRADTIGSVLKSAASVTILVIAFMMILTEVNVDLAPLIAGTSIVGVALGFGAQNVVKDFLSGMFMILEDQYGVGDVIDVKEAIGTVEAVGLRTTSLRDNHGTVWYVRNGEIVRVGNKSQGYAQIVLDLPIAADSDADAASAIMLEVAEAMHADEEWASAFLGEPELQGVQSMTREETVIRLVVKVHPDDQWRTARELRRRVRARLTSHQIDLSPSADSSDADASGADDPA